MYGCQVINQNPRPGEPDPERARLSKRAVVDRALKLADADGLDTLTIRKLAQDRGVTPMALYWHLRNMEILPAAVSEHGKDDLLEAMSEQVWGEIKVTVGPVQPRWTQLQGGLESLIQVLRAHRSAPQLVLEHEKRNEAALRATEAPLRILTSAGFDADHASEIARSTLWTGITLVMSETSYHPELSDDERTEFQRRSQVELAMLPAARYPHLVRCAAPMANCDPEFHYRLGVELFIAGVRAIAERQPGA